MSQAEPDTYTVDTSSLARINESTNSNEIWSIIVRLVEEGRLFAHPTVMKELMGVDGAAYLRLSPHRKQMVKAQSDQQFLDKLGEITFRHPAMSKARLNKNPADPYVVAQAALHGAVVVSNETRTRRPNRKIPGVCDAEGIRCITLDELVEVERDENQ